MTPPTVATDPIRERWSDTKLARGLYVLAIVLFCYSHGRGFFLPAFSDDLGIVRVFAQKASEGGLWQQVYSRITGALADGGLMWRPIPYVSFGLSAEFFGDHVSAWRAINVLLHVGASFAVASLLRALGYSSLIAAFGFGLFLLQPWVPEVTIWLVGRYDAFATCFIVLALACAARSQSWDRWLGLSVLCAVVAYASKESAIILGAALLLVLLVRDAQAQAIKFPFLSRNSAVALSVHALFVLAYMLVRHLTLGSINLDLYNAEKPIFSFFSWAKSFLLHLSTLYAFGSIAQSISHLTCIGVMISVLVSFVQRRTHTAAVAGLLMSGIVLASLALVFPYPDATRDGWRVYHLAAVGFSVAAAGLLARGAVWRTSLAIMVLLGLAVWQRAAVEEWRVAGNAMSRLQTEFKRVGANLPAADYGLLVVPDAVGRVPFARNAQGGLLLAYSGDRERMSQMIIATEWTLPEWFTLSHLGIVAKLANRADAPPGPTQFYCFDGQQLQPLGFWQVGSQTEWNQRWTAALATRCPNFKRAIGA